MVFGVLFVSLVANAVTTISGTAITLENGETISNSTDGVIKLGGASDKVQILGTASTSALEVGDEAVSTINGIVFGYCTLGAVALTSATTTMGSCTGATGVASEDRIFVQATSSLPVATFITAASSTAANVIQVRFHATNGATDIDAATVSLNFWAVR